MKIKVRHLRRVLSLLSEKTNETLDHAGLRNIAAKITGISEDYLYKKVWYAIKNLGDDTELNLRDAQLNSVAKFLGFGSIGSLTNSLESPADQQLQSLLGNYYLFVRQNSGKGLVFQSPAEILQSNGKFLLRLAGPTQTYEGVMSIRHGCLFVLLQSQEQKSFYHIYKIGTRRAPQVIQGIFSGVSTAFDPIGGRVVMIRVSDQSERKNMAYTLDELERSDKKGYSSLAAYFREYHKNNLSIAKVISFGFDDLEES